MLDRSFAAELNYDIKGQHVGGAVGGPVAYSVVSGVNIQIGDLQWNGAAVAIDLNSTSKRLGHPLPVILGGDMFKEAVVEIDFVGRRIAFHEPASFEAPSRAQVAPLVPAFEAQAIPVLIEGRKAMLLFDLGNAGTLDLYPRFWSHAGFIKKRRTSTSFGGGGRRRARIKNLALEPT